jgi:hypothetical protein
MKERHVEYLSIQEVVDKYGWMLSEEQIKIFKEHERTVSRRTIRNSEDEGETDIRDAGNS